MIGYSVAQKLHKCSNHQSTNKPILPGILLPNVEDSRSPDSSWCGERKAGLRGFLGAYFDFDALFTELFMDRSQRVFARWQVLDLEAAILRGHGKIRMWQHAQVSLH